MWRFFCHYSRLTLSRIPSDSLIILRDIRTSTYKNCRIEGKITRTNLTNIFAIGLLEIRILQILWKRGAISPLFHNIFKPVVRFSRLDRDQIFT